MMKRKREAPNSRIWGGVAAAALAVGMVLALAQIVANAPKTTESVPVNDAVMRDIQDPRVREVASHFLCPCSMCDGMELDECMCDAPNGGIASKEKIAGLLKQGVTPEEAVRRLVPILKSLKQKQFTIPSNRNANY